MILDTLFILQHWYHTCRIQLYIIIMTCWLVTISITIYLLNKSSIKISYWITRFMICPVNSYDILSSFTALIRGWRNLVVNWITGNYSTPNNQLWLFTALLIAFTWFTSSLDFRENSGSNREDETSPKFESSSTSFIYLCDHLGMAEMANSGISVTRLMASVAALTLFSRTSFLISRMTVSGGKGVKYVRLPAPYLLPWLLCLHLKEVAQLGCPNHFRE